MSGELFKMLTGINMQHVPYRGGAPALTDMLSGVMQVMFDNIPTCAEHVKSGKLRGLAVSQYDTLGGATGSADGRRLPARLRGERLVWPRGRRRIRRLKSSHAQQGGQRNPRRSKAKARFTELGAILLPGSAANSESWWRRNREMGQGGQVRGRQGGLARRCGRCGCVARTFAALTVTSKMSPPVHTALSPGTCCRCCCRCTA